MASFGRFCSRVVNSSVVKKPASALPKAISARSNPWICSNQSATIIRRNFIMSTPQRAMATYKADTDLAEFLTEEIAAEKENQKSQVDMTDFDVKKEGAELTLSKKHGDEKLVISLNVNHTVDSAEPDDGSQEAPEMKSRPNFEVDIVKSDGKTLSFSCSYLSADMVDEAAQRQPGSDQQHFDDAFVIDEVTMFENEDWSDKRYAVAGDILDGYLYDLFMNMLDERGVDKAFVERLSDFASAYEHQQYISMLEDLKKFVK